MNQLLGQLTGSQGRLFDQMIERWEGATHQSGYDGALVGQIATDVNYKLQQLGFESTVASQELRQALKQCFKQLERQFEQRFPSDQALTEALNEELAEVEVLELSTVARQRLSGGSAELFEQIATIQRGYFQASPLRVTLGLLDFDQRLVAEVGLQPAKGKLASYLLTVLVIAERVRQSNQLALILASEPERKPSKLLSWLQSGFDFRWTLAGFSVVSSTIESMLADQQSSLFQKLQAEHSDLAGQLTSFKLEKLTNQLLDNQFFADSYGLGLVREQVVSLNIFDQLTGSSQYLQAAVYDRLVTQYLQNPNLTKQIIEQLIQKVRGRL